MNRASLNRAGFTLMDLIISIGIISILMVIVYGAINPRKQYENAQETDRKYSMRVLEHAVAQYIIDGNPLPPVPYGIANAVPICQEGITGTDCTVTAGGYDLSGLSLNGRYIAELPIDPAEDGATYTGYYIYAEGGFKIICSPLDQPACGG